MVIYVGHSKDISYVEELYKPIRELEKDIDCTFILPHEGNTSNNNSREFYANLDLFIAEVSLPATGLGIELGWAYDSNIPIFCISKKGKKIGASLKSVTNNFFEYETVDDLKKTINLIIETMVIK